jgi:NADP-dependent 3-hydroxy acid dehydrogenase YdfG
MLVMLIEPDDCQKVMDMALEKFDKLDTLVNNTGLTPDALIHKMT